MQECWCDDGCVEAHTVSRSESKFTMQIIVFETFFCAMLSKECVQAPRHYRYVDRIDR